MDTERTEKPRPREKSEADLAIKPADGHVALLRYESAQLRLAADVPALLAELDDTRAQLAWLSDVRDSFELVLERERERLAERDATIARAFALHTPGPMLDHYEYGCTCGFRDHRWSECRGCFYVLDDEGENDRGIRGRVCPTVAALGGEPETAEPATASRYLENLRKLGASERLVDAAERAASDACPGPAASGTPAEEGER